MHDLPDKPHSLGIFISYSKLSVQGENSFSSVTHRYICKVPTIFNINFPDKTIILIPTLVISIHM